MHGRSHARSDENTQPNLPGCSKMELAWPNMPRLDFRTVYALTQDKPATSVCYFLVSVALLSAGAAAAMGTMLADRILSSIGKLLSE